MCLLCVFFLVCGVVVVVECMVAQTTPSVAAFVCDFSSRRRRRRGRRRRCSIYKSATTRTAPY